MREIKFRGKDNNGKWHYGYIYECNGYLGKDGRLTNEGTTNRVSGYCINNYLIKRETIGQYTDLKDKNGVEIYEGDILKLDGWNDCHPVVFKRGYFRGGDGGYLNLERYINDVNGVNVSVVIGNICDNPELINRKE